MPNIESEKNISRNDNKESANLVGEAYDFANHARPDIEGRLRQANLIGYGAIAGGIKDIPNEFLHHPWETIGKASVAGASGVALGAALAGKNKNRRVSTRRIVRRPCSTQIRGNSWYRRSL